MKRLVAWFVGFFRRKTKPQPASTSRMLDVVIDGEAVSVHVVGVVAMSLIAQTTNGQRIVTENHATDPTEFWRMWKSFGLELVWEDGESFHPGEGNVADLRRK